MLIVFSGLPGVGKTTLARRLAAERRATYLRIDTIEQALRDSGMLAGAVGPAGYVVAYALAEANLRQGQVVVADGVNPLPVTRAAWRGVAAAAGVAAIELEITCGDPAEHRRRVEGRVADIPGHAQPDWASVQRHDYAAWDTPRHGLDTAGLPLEAAMARLRALVDGPPPG
ncbi:AAA family ATPase [Roseomonas sp. 18066]|uniref:AAA family ATPase n=1 Tax=Roseomonas sp. 18066 TaxID=2681412 RepID=UPI001357F7CB|nr:AAA family ATPase [Roseomonas sp. 18066]